MVELDPDSLTKEHVNTLISDIELAETAKYEDIFYTRDPADAAILLCFGAKLVKVKFVKEAIFARRKHRRLVMFGFEGNHKCLKALTAAKLDIRSSKDVTNVNIGEYLNYFKFLKTIINSSF